MNYVSAMFTERPYVVLLIIAFWIVAPAERGYLRAGVWFERCVKNGGQVAFAQFHE